MKISVLVPMYNEGERVDNFFNSVIPFLQKNFENWEIFVVDDGSTDSTLRGVENFSKTNKRILVVPHKKNMGIGAGLKTGLKHVTGDIIITMDSDLTYDVENIPKLIKAMKEKNADIVIGTPFLNKKDHKEIPFIRYAASRLGNYIDQLLFGLNFTTSTCFFRAWKKSAAKNVKITFERFAGVSESAIRMHKMGFKIVEIPVKYNLRRTSRKISDIRTTIRNTKEHIKMILSLLMT